MGHHLAGIIFRICGESTPWKVRKPDPTELRFTLFLSVQIIYQWTRGFRGNHHQSSNKWTPYPWLVVWNLLPGMPIPIAGGPADHFRGWEKNSRWHETCFTTPIDPESGRSGGASFYVTLSGIERCIILAIWHWFPNGWYWSSISKCVQHPWNNWQPYEVSVLSNEVKSHAQIVLVDLSWSTSTAFSLSCSIALAH